MSGKPNAPGSSRARFLSRVPAAWRYGAIASAAIVLAVAGGLFAREEMRYLEPVEIERAPFPERGINVPSIAERNGVTYFGKVKLRIYIQKSGNVDRVEVAETSVPREIAEDTAKRFSAVAWEPGTRSGRKRRSVYIVEVGFEPPVMGPRTLTPEN